MSDSVSEGQFTGAVTETIGAMSDVVARVVYFLRAVFEAIATPSDSLSVPLYYLSGVAVGIGNIVAFAQILTVPPPICQPSEPNRVIAPFRWNQTFGRGDLEICLKDRTGNQRGPVFIGYTMYIVTPTGIMHQVGPLNRKPAQSDVGKFYVTGTAGENGQPGCWAVKWQYQMTYSVPVQESIVQFRVLDAVLDCDRPDHVRRHCKYGWDL